MTLGEIQARLAEILAAEEALQVDWTNVDHLCDELDRQIEASKCLIQKFLNSSNILRFGA